MKKNREKQYDEKTLMPNPTTLDLRGGNPCEQHFDFLKPVLMPSAFYRPSWESNKNRFLII